MFWKITCQPADSASDERQAASPTHDAPDDGRFVLHRHSDADGPHLDLRLEAGDHLLGWRIDGPNFDGEPWATEKGPHPLSWLEQDSDAQRQDAGHYRWVERHPDRRVLVLEGRYGPQVVCAERQPALPARVVRSLVETLTELGEDADRLGGLVRDGATARTRAIERLCGLGRELDGRLFEETIWRKTLAGLSLDEIHAQLRSLEVRFDRKYEPRPVSRAETLPDVEEPHRRGSVLAILRDSPIGG